MVQYSDEQKTALDRYYPYPNNLVDLFYEGVNKYANRRFFGIKNSETKQYEWVTYLDIAERINNLRGGLSQLDFEKGDSIGVIINNSPEWFIIENATHGLGGRFVPMYEKELERTWKYIIQDSAIKYLFVKNEDLLEKVTHFEKEIPTLQKIFVIYGNGEKSLSSLEELGKGNPIEPYRPHWSEIAVLIYTSGTTGEPKGVLLSHGNLTHCSRAGYEIFPDLNESSISLSILPWAHSYGLSAELHDFIQFGGSIGIMESVETLADDIAAVKPTYLIAVPRVFNKIYDGIQAKMKEAGGLKKRLFDMACKEAAQQRNRDKKSLKLKILDFLVFSRIRSRFGGRLVGAMTASAVMNPDIARFFLQIGIPTYDCYGLTETSPAITMNSPLNGNRYGTVGKAVKDMHVAIDRSRVGEDSADGEIIAYGAHVMMGYHNKPEQTAEIMVDNSWNGFHGIRTGDIGRIDEDGFLHITGRYKDEYKLSNGKYVHPESIETDMKLLPHVANAFVYGDGRAYNVSVVVPDFEIIKKDPNTGRWEQMDPGQLVANDEFKEFLSSEITEHLKKSYGGYEVPKQYFLVDEDFTLENGMLTQTMKLKRREVLKKYQGVLEEFYKN